MGRLSSTSRLDPEMLAQLRELASGDDLTPVLELLGLFYDTTPTRMKLIDDALQSGDTRAASEQAHGLKSAAASVGAARLGQIFLDLEKSAGADLAAARALLHEARTEFEAVRVALDAEFSSKHRGE